MGYKNLENIIENIDERKRKEFLNLDQLFTDGKYIYFVEQKIRDDHDSTKKRGQFENFEKKIIALLQKYTEKELKSFTYFIDFSLTKNKNFYNKEIQNIQKDYNIYSKLCYGEEFWEELNHKEIWNEILMFLEKWKKEIPDMPSVNFDEDANSSFNELKNIPTTIFRKLFDNKEICKEIFPVIFPENKTLLLLKNYFEELEDAKTIYKNLAKKIEIIIDGKID